MHICLGIHGLVQPNSLKEPGRFSMPLVIGNLSDGKALKLNQKAPVMVIKDSLAWVNWRGTGGLTSNEGWGRGVFGRDGSG